MPLYIYSCDECSHKFEARHGMFFEEQRCAKCHSEHVFKIPSIGSGAPTLQGPSSTRPGQVVDRYIEDTKNDIKREKKKLRSEEL